VSSTIIRGLYYPIALPINKPSEFFIHAIASCVELLDGGYDPYRNKLPLEGKNVQAEMQAEIREICST